MAQKISDEVLKEANEVFSEIDIDATVSKHTDMDARRRLEDKLEEMKLLRELEEFDFRDDRYEGY